MPPLPIIRKLMQPTTDLFAQATALFDKNKLSLAGKKLKSLVHEQPGLAEAWSLWGDILFSQGHMQEAKEKYEKALKFKVSSELHWDLARVWFRLSQSSGEALDLRVALQHFEQARSLPHDFPAEFWYDRGCAYLELALLLNDNGHFGQAAELFHTATELRPLFLDAWLKLAEAHTQLYLNTLDEKFVAKTSAAYEKAIALDPKCSDAWLGLGQILAESGKLNRNEAALQQSIQKCKKALTVGRKNVAAFAQLVESLSALGVLTSNLELLKEAEKRVSKAPKTFTEDADYWYADGVRLMAFAQYFEDLEAGHSAIEQFQHGLTFDRTNAEMWHALGLAHKLVADLTHDEILIERAARFLAKAMDLKPLCPGLMYDAACTFLHHSQAFDDIASLDYSLSLFETLLQTHQTVVLHHPEWLFQYASAMDWLADYTGEEKDFLRTIDLFSHVLLIEPEFPGAHLKIAENYVLLGHENGDGEAYRKALSAFKQAVVQDAENGDVWLAWSLCCIHLAKVTLDGRVKEKLFEEAEEKIAQAGKLGHLGAYYHMASLYSLLDRTDEAMGFVQKAFEVRALPPLNAMLADEALEKLRLTPQFAGFLSELETKMQAREQ